MESVNSAVKNILRKFEKYYDIKEYNLLNPKYVAVFHASLERYVLTRKANLWTADDNEYVFFYEGGILTEDELKKNIDTSLSLSRDFIKPDRNHRSSIATSIMVYGSADPGVRKSVEKYRYYRSFKFTLNGWMRHRIIVLNVGDSEVYSDSYSKELKELIISDGTEAEK